MQYTHTFNFSKISFFGKTFTMATIHGMSGYDDPIVAQILNDKFDETESISFWAFRAANAPAGSLFLDVGAFSGIFGLVAAKMNYGIRTIAVEPATMTFGRLGLNIQLNKLQTQVIPVNLAASNTSGYLQMPHKYGIYNLCPGESLSGFPQIDHTQSVKSICLDQILDDDVNLPDYLNSKGIPFKPFSSISTIKIDVERHEIEVLEGCIKIIEEYRPVFICESLGNNEENKLLSFFSTYSYDAVKIEKERNILFLPKEHSSLIMESFNQWKQKFPQKIAMSGILACSYSLDQ